VHAALGTERIGEIVPVLIERAEPNSLAGAIVPEANAPLLPSVWHAGYRA